jgi:general secretion pathway protein G
MAVADQWIVISACLVLLIIGLPRFRSVVEQSRVIVAIGEIKQISRSIDSYRLLNDLRYPETLADVGQSDRLDPWGNRYEYRLLATRPGQPSRTDRRREALNTDYDLFSVGRDGRTLASISAEPSQDDILRAANGLYFDLASKY